MMEYFKFAELKLLKFNNYDHHLSSVEKDAWYLFKAVRYNKTENLSLVIENLFFHSLLRFFPENLE